MKRLLKNRLLMFRKKERSWNEVILFVVQWILDNEQATFTEIITDVNPDASYH